MVNFVIAKYNENIEWTQKLNHKKTIYDKSNSPIEGSIPLKNIGREGETFLFHIVNNYNNLDDVTVFLQGNPFEHLQLLVGWRAQLSSEEIDTVIHKMNSEINDRSDFSSFYQIMYNDPSGMNGTKTTEICQKYFGKYFQYFTLAPGAQYIVPKKYIISRPIEFWKCLHSAMLTNEIDAWTMEQLWYYAFKNEMNYKIGNHDIEKQRCLCIGPNLQHSPISYFINNNIPI
jgi:hypothetical protein